MITNIILHGHFYQPPREYPGTGIIPLQKSAEPYASWNEKIYRECYRPNAYSRQLTHDGRISDISNNYSRISFNFGPTLMKWLKEESEDAYSKIVEADRISAERLNGHGNAVAQTYNHTILPLDSPQDAETQLVWGLQDFYYHFNRDPEGIWLPETAINQQTVELLIKYGISFVILSPWQVDKVIFDNGKNIDFSSDSSPILWNQPFRLEGESGSISALFYNPELASGISFGHFLRDADTLYSSIKEYSEADGGNYSLIHTATDGEIYGHHEPFGDMCLAALIQKIDNDPSLQLTNYGAFLEKHPPQATARLKAGENSRGTSWSCSHGVSRWYKDCGCSTGGKKNWNQKWRAPLRTAFEELSASLLAIYFQETKDLLLQDPWKILLDYGKVISGVESPGEFIQKLTLKNNSPESREKLLCLLEGQKYRHFMFTSCGWFFADISGVEPGQNIQYALHAINLYSGFTDTNLRKQLEISLEKAESNIPKKKNGKMQLLSVLPKISGIYESAIYFALMYVYTPDDSPHNSDYGMFHLQDFQVRDSKGKEFSVKIEDTSILKHYNCDISIQDSAEDEMMIRISSDARMMKPINIPLHQLQENVLSNSEKWTNKSIRMNSGFNPDKHVTEVIIQKHLDREVEKLAYSPNAHGAGELAEVLYIIIKSGFNVDISRIQELAFDWGRDKQYADMHKKQGYLFLTQQLGIAGIS